MMAARDARGLTQAERERLTSPAYHLAHDILAKADYHDQVRNVGFADVQYDTGTDSVDLWWKGPLSRAVARLVKAAPSRHVEVRLHEAAYSRGYVITKMRHWGGDSELDTAGIEVVATWPAGEGSGIGAEIRCRHLPGNPATGAATVRKVGLRQTGVLISDVVTRSWLGEDPA